MSGSVAASLPVAFEKVMVFIDGSNLYHSLRSLGEVRIDYSKLLQTLVAGRNLIQAYYFCSLPPGPKQQQLDFLTKLRSLGFEVKSFPLRLRKGIFVEKGVDVALATEFLVQAFNKNYDVGILVSGDEDFKGIVGEAKRFGRKVEIAALSAAASKEFQQCANKFVPLDVVIPAIKLR